MGGTQFARESRGCATEALWQRNGSGIGDVRGSLPGVLWERHGSVSATWRCSASGNRRVNGSLSDVLRQCYGPLSGLLWEYQACDGCAIKRNWSVAERLPELFGNGAGLLSQSASECYRHVIWLVQDSYGSATGGVMGECDASAKEQAQKRCGQGPGRAWERFGKHTEWNGNGLWCGSVAVAPRGWYIRARLGSGTTTQLVHQFMRGYIGRSKDIITNDADWHQTAGFPAELQWILPNTKV